MMKMEKKRAVMTEIAEIRKNKLMQKKKKTPVAKSERMAQEKIGVHIPGDIIPEILLRLPARSLGKFRCVSKSWLSITSNTAFVRANTQHNLITRHSLIIGECDDTILPSKSYLAFGEATSESAIGLQTMESMPENSYVIASCDGLVCVLSSLDFQYYVSNPLTGQSIALPLDRLHVPLTSSLGFYFHRSTSKYRLIRFTKTRHESEVLVVGESSWRRIPGCIPAFCHCEYPLDLSGKLYWLAHTRRELAFELPPDIIVIFDEEEEVYSVICPPPSKKLQDLGGNLVNFNGELGLWVVGVNGTIDLWIMENFWIKMYSVNNAHIPKCPSRFKATTRSRAWILGGAISIGDEELLVGLSAFLAPHYLVRWNLKSGACVLRHLIDQSSSYLFAFPYTETLANPQYSAST